MFLVCNHLFMSKRKDVKGSLTCCVEHSVCLDIDEHEVVGHARLAIVDVRMYPCDDLLETGHEDWQTDKPGSGNHTCDVGDRTLTDDVGRVDTAEEFPEMIEKVANEGRTKTQQVKHQKLKQQDFVFFSIPEPVGVTIFLLRR
jgi:hypothetical protein